MRRRTLTALALLVLAVGAVAVPDVRARVACPEEDSPACIWWGPFQGNGRGSIVVNGWR